MGWREVIQKTVKPESTTEYKREGRNKPEDAPKRKKGSSVYWSRNQLYYSPDTVIKPILIDKETDNFSKVPSSKYRSV